MLGLTDIIISKKIVLEDQDKFVLKSPGWVLALYLVLGLLKIPYFIFWGINLSGLKLLNFLINIPYFFIPAFTPFPATWANVLMIVLLAFFIYDVYMVFSTLKTIVFIKETKIIRMKGILKNKSYQLGDHFYIKVRNKGLYPNFVLFQKLRDVKKGPFSNSASLFATRDLFCVARKDPGYQHLLKFLEENKIRII